MSSVSVSSVLAVDTSNPISLKFVEVSLTISSLPERIFGITENHTAIEVTEWDECIVLHCYRV
jgi:fibronectin type 3 domain-containing protein